MSWASAVIFLFCLFVWIVLEKQEGLASFLAAARKHPWTPVINK